MRKCSWRRSLAQGECERGDAANEDDYGRATGDGEDLNNRGRIDAARGVEAETMKPYLVEKRADAALSGIDQCQPQAVAGQPQSRQHTHDAAVPGDDESCRRMRELIGLLVIDVAIARGLRCGLDAGGVAHQ